MFTPLRYQASDADCFPTAMLNALVWLFEAERLPGAVVQRVYAGALDGIERGVPGSYTSRHAGLALAEWLGRYKTRSFAVATEALEGEAVELAPGSRLVRWLRRGGVAVLDVCDTPATMHSVLALAAGAEYLELWDSWLRPLAHDYGPGILRLETDGRAANLRIARSRLAGRGRRPYALGPRASRAAVLIRRTR